MLTFLGPGGIAGGQAQKGEGKGRKARMGKVRGSLSLSFSTISSLFSSPIPSHSLLPSPTPPLSDACLADNAARVALFYLMSYTQQNTLN